MAFPTIVLNNTTGSPIDLGFITIAASSSETVLSPTVQIAFPSEFLDSPAVQTNVDSGAVTITYNGTLLTAAQGSALIQSYNELRVKQNVDADAPPTVTDDADAGYSVGSIWIDTTNGAGYLCLDASPGSAAWSSLGGGSTPVVDDTQNGLQPQSDRAATTDPAVTDDANDGWLIGSYWVNTTTGAVFVCVDNTVGAAVWRTTGGGDGGDTMIWGARLNTVGTYAEFNGSYNDSATNLLDVQSQGTVTATGQLRRFTWNTQSAVAGSTVWNVLKDGVVVETITATGPSGTVTGLSCPVTAGVEKLAIEYDSGPRPDRGTYYLGITAGTA